MPQAKLTPEEWESLCARRRQGAPISELARTCPLTPKTLENKFQLYGVHPEVAESQRPRYVSPPKLDTDCLIICDSHIPFHDAGFVNAVFSLSQTWGIRSLFLAGDILDITALSQFSSRPEDTLSKELTEAGHFLGVCCERFEKVLLVLGNHERRFLHFLREQLREEHLLALIGEKRLTISNYSYGFVQGQGHLRNWLIGHPRNISVIPGRVPTFLSRKFPKYSVGSGHGHLAGMAFADDGERLVIDIGVTCDPKRLDYISEHLTTRPAVAQGALILKQTTKGVVPYWLWPGCDFDALRRCYGSA
jgi:predicted phosphodiesterase